MDSVSKLPKEVRDVIAGGLAGIIAKSVVAPISRIKILYQVSSTKFRIQNVPSVILDIIKQEGVTALWKGNLAALIRVFPYSGIQFMAYDKCKHLFLDRPNRSLSTLTGLESFLSGMVAGAVSVLCTYPLDLIRVQLAVLNKTKSQDGFFSLVKQNVRNRGAIIGLYRAIHPTLLGILPYAGIAFALNETGKREIRSLRGREVTTVEKLQCGAVAGLGAQTVAYPFEVIRRRMQTIGIVGGKNGSTTWTSLGGSSKQPVYQKPPSMRVTIRHLYAEQGIRGFLKGVSLNWIKGPLAFSISFTAYDHIQKLMETQNERTNRRVNR